MFQRTNQTICSQLECLTPALGILQLFYVAIEKKKKKNSNNSKKNFQKSRSTAICTRRSIVKSETRSGGERENVETVEERVSGNEKGHLSNEPRFQTIARSSRDALHRLE